MRSFILAALAATLTTSAALADTSVKIGAGAGDAGLDAGFTEVTDNTLVGTVSLTHQYDNGLRLALTADVISASDADAVAITGNIGYGFDLDPVTLYATVGLGAAEVTETDTFLIGRASAGAEADITSGLFVFGEVVGHYGETETYGVDVDFEAISGLAGVGVRF